MLCPVFMRNLKLDNHTKVFTGIITENKSNHRKAVLDLELLGLSSDKDHEDTKIYHLSRKVVIVSPNVEAQIEGNPEPIEIPTPLGVILSSLPVGTKIAFTGKPYDPYIKREKDPLSIEDNDRIVLNNQYLEVVGFNSTIAKNIFKYQESQETEKKRHKKWARRFHGETFPQKLSVKLSPFFSNWLVRSIIGGIIVTVIGGLILLVFGEPIKNFFQN